jgi:ABC-type multidrug transport system fused ATPase/permease subunit
MAVKNGYMVGFSFFQVRLLARWKSELSHRLMRMYLLSDFRMHMEKKPSEMIRNLALTGILYDHYIVALLMLTVNSFLALGIVVLLMLSLPGQTLFSVSALGLTAVALYFSLRKHFQQIGEDNNELYRLRSILLQQAIGAIRESKILGREDYFLTQFKALEYRSFSRQGHYNFLSNLPGLGLETIIVFSMLAVVLHVIFVSGGGSQGLATIGLLAAAMFRLLPMVTKILVSLQLMNMGKDSLQTVALELATNEHRVRDPGVGDGERLTGWSRIELRNVSYTYPDGTRALTDVSVTLRRNEFFGITGPSGSGKSTLMMLLLGLIEPTEGIILVDDQPLSDAATLRRWQNGIGYVPQGLFLVDGSLAQNIAFGDGNPDLERVAAAAHAAQLTEYVDSQPHGLLESIGEYGERLSGGQKQRVVIARALYRQPDFVAFDEATAAQDVRIEHAIKEHISDLKGQMTMVAIAHRLATIQHCDKIVYLELGRLAGFGTFEEVREASDGFRHLAKLSNL